MYLIPALYILMYKNTDSNLYVALSGRNADRGHATQGVAIGLGYIGLSARRGAMKNVCDKAECPP
jgi:hypothetical protein